VEETASQKDPLEVQSQVSVELAPDSETRAPKTESPFQSYVLRQLRRPAASGELLVGRTTEPGSLGRAIASVLQERTECRVLASGDEAVNQFVKGVSFARMHIKRMEGDVCFRASHLFWLDRNSSKQLNFDVKRVPDPLIINTPVEAIRVCRETDMRGLSKSIKASLSKHGMVDVLSMGTVATARSIVASTWTRRMCIVHDSDVDCYASLRDVEGDSNPYKAHVACLTMVERASDELKDARSRFALHSIQFETPIDRLGPVEEIFSESVDVDLPIVKISAITHPNRAASALIRYLRCAGGVQVFSSGCMANNQALKSITVARSYVREIVGYDVGFQCIHAPRDNRNGECQVVTWLRLMSDMSKNVAELDASKVHFTIGNLNDAKSVGSSMAAQIEHCRRVDCTVSGIAAAARTLVAISHARMLLASKKLDLVALPQFESIPVVFDLQKQEFIRLRFSLLVFKCDRSQLSTPLLRD